MQADSPIHPSCPVQISTLINNCKIADFSIYIFYFVSINLYAFFNQFENVSSSDA